MQKIVLLIKAKDGCDAEKIKDEISQSELIESVKIF